MATTEHSDLEQQIIKTAQQLFIPHFRNSFILS